LVEILHLTVSHKRGSPAPGLKMDGRSRRPQKPSLADGVNSEKSSLTMHFERPTCQMHDMRFLPEILLFPATGGDFGASIKYAGSGLAADFVFEGPLLARGI